jgi:hypothetical protein
VGGEESFKVMNHLKKFNANKKLEEATLSGKINFLIDKKEFAEMKFNFIKLNKNNGGRLTKDKV